MISVDVCIIIASSIFEYGFGTERKNDSFLFVGCSCKT